MASTPPSPTFSGPRQIAERWLAIGGIFGFLAFGWGHVQLRYRPLWHPDLLKPNGALAAQGAEAFGEELQLAQLRALLDSLPAQEPVLFVLGQAAQPINAYLLLAYVSWPHPLELAVEGTSFDPATAQKTYRLILQPSPPSHPQGTVVKLSTVLYAVLTPAPQ